MESVVVITVPDAGEGREMLRELHELDTHEGFHLDAAALVERAGDGRVTLVEAEEDPKLGATAAGTTIGLVLGALTGPIGLLVGGATGAAVGSLVDVADDEDSWTVVRSVSRAVPPGRAAVVAVVAESTPDGLDRLATRVDATLWRRPRADVELELAAAEQAVIAAHRDAARARSIGDRLRDVKEALTGKR